MNHAQFVLGNTALTASALRADLRLHLATRLTPLWQATENMLQKQNIAPPFWAFSWPGSEALAAYIGANPGLVCGLRILDFAAGAGLAGIAAARAGGIVEAAEIDPFARAAISLNAAANEAEINVLEADITGAPCRWDVILCGDVCYEAPMTRHILPWLRECAATATVIIADPGRSYAPKDGFTEIACFTVPTLLELEDSTTRAVKLLRLNAA